MAKRIIMVANYKGGSGKSQTSLEMAYWLARHGKRVLLADLDHQANSTKVLSRGIPTGKRTIADILIEGDVITRSDISSRNIGIDDKHIDFISSGLAAGRLEKKLPDDSPKEYVLKDALENVLDDYDYIILDTPPSAELISTCALIASDTILITTQASFFSADGVKELMPVIKRVKKHPRMNPGLEILGILITMYEETKDSRYIVSDLRKTYGRLVVTPYIRKSTKVKESNRYYKAVQAYAPNSTSAADYKAVFYNLLGKELNLYSPTTLIY